MNYVMVLQKFDKVDIIVIKGREVYFGKNYVGRYCI